MVSLQNIKVVFGKLFVAGICINENYEKKWIMKFYK
jgi:hypothetical protein